MDRDDLYVHVDQCRSVFIDKETVSLRRVADENAVAVLDGIYVDLGSDDMQSSAVKLP